MIKLELKDYCHDCTGFEADVEEPAMLFAIGASEPIKFTDTIIRCAHRKRCEHIVKYVMEGYKEDEK